MKSPSAIQKRRPPAKRRYTGLVGNEEPDPEALQPQPHDVQVQNLKPRAFTGVAGSPLAKVIDISSRAKPSTKGMVLLHFCFDQQAGESKQEHCRCEERAERVTREIAEGYVQEGCADWLIVKNAKAKTGISCFHRAIVIRSAIVDDQMFFKVPSSWEPSDRRRKKHETIKADIRSKARRILSRLFAKGVISQEIFNMTDGALEELFQDAEKSEAFLNNLTDQGQHDLRKKFFEVIVHWWNNVLGFYRLNVAASMFMPEANRGVGAIVIKGDGGYVELIQGQHDTRANGRRVEGANARTHFWNGGWSHSNSVDAESYKEGSVEEDLKSNKEFNDEGYN